MASRRVPAKSSSRRSRLQQREVALAFPIAPAHLFAVTRGVTDYASQHGNWLLTTHGESANLPIQRLRGWTGDGVIAILTSAADVRAARRFLNQGVPVVTFSATLPRSRVPRVRTDSAAIGRLAAEHLIARGYAQFGLYGLHGVTYSSDRGRAFIERLAESGFRCTSLQSPNTFGSARPWENEIESLAHWLRTLSRPAGVFAVNDYRAQLVASACKSIGLRVPRDIGIIGADNNHVICEFSSPSLSSVDCNWYRVGLQTAELLDLLMNGGDAPTSDLLVQPTGVVQRASTDLPSAKDPRLQAAIQYIREHLAEVFGVERLVLAAQMPRRTFELKFIRDMGCSPYDYLCGQRVDRAKSLLRASAELSLSEIARRCGFSDLRRFREVFRRVERTTPAAFRALHHAGVKPPRQPL